MSEAGPRWLNRGTGGGLAALLSAPATEQGERGLVGGRRFGRGKRWHGCAALWKASLVPAEFVDRKGGEATPARQGASAITVCGSRTGGQCPTRVMPSPDRPRAAPSWGSKHDDCSWCTRHPHPRHHSGPGTPSKAASRRQRLRCCSKAHTNRASGKAGPKNGGRAGASRKPSRKLTVSQGARLTTRWLQRLVRGTFSPKADGAE